MRFSDQSKSFYQRWSHILPSDRSMALFRIFMGISVLYNMLHVRLPNLKILYGQDRFFPPEITDYINNSSTISVFDYIHNDVFAIAFFSAGIAAALLFTLGKWTRWSCAATLFVFWNLVQSNSIYSFGFDHYTFNILLCGLLLPLGNTWSLDALKDGAKPFRPRLALAFILLVQIAVIYFVTGILKNGESWIQGYAVRNMLSDPYTTTALGKALRDVKAFYVPSTYLTLILEIAAPFFIFLKTRNNWLRWTGAIGIIAFHVLILLTYKVANFPISGIAVGCLLLPLEQRVPYTENAGLGAPAGYRGFARRTFALTWIAIMLNSAFFYVAGQPPYDKSPLLKDVTSMLSFLDFHPIETSPAYQKWTMFAPNPFALTGWLAIEKHDGNIRTDLVSDLPVKPDGPVYKPRGWLFYMSYYGRKWDAHSNPKYFIFVKYWIYNTLKNNGLNEKDPKIYLVDYKRRLKLQRTNYISPLEPKAYPIKTILDYPLIYERNH